MRARTRKLIGTVVLLLCLAVYATVAAVMVREMRKRRIIAMSPV